MSRKNSLLASEATQAWIAQFDPADQVDAADLVKSILIVNWDRLFSNIEQMVLERACLYDGPVGVYAEREIVVELGNPTALFSQPTDGVRRAFGNGPPPVAPINPKGPNVGSEGIVAFMLSQICKANPKKILNHPGPHQIRKNKVRAFILVTDFIGSGSQATKYLDAAWRVSSVRSWWSSRAKKGMSFEVIAYAATSSGKLAVEEHPCQPEVHIAAECPTVHDLAGAKRRQRLINLCAKYDPLKGKSESSLGYKGTGALIAFSHGAPNNSPNIIVCKSTEFSPLFHKRLTTNVRAHFTTEPTDADQVAMQLLNLRQAKLAAASWLPNVKPASRALFLVLACLSRPPRSESLLSRKTGLTIFEVRKALSVARGLGWITDENRLTETGQLELKHARKEVSEVQPLPEDPEVYYCPKALRASPKVSG